MVRTLSEQVRDAFEKTGWSVAELLRRSGLDIDRSSLARKLSGDLPMKTGEAECLAAVLDVTLAFVPNMKPAAEGAA